jgi:hypothetical protein
MRLLLKRGKQGDVLKGSDQELLERALFGDDLSLYIESIGYDESIMFGNYVVSEDCVSSLSLPHLDHGDLPDPTVLDREPITVVQYIYDSKTNNVLVKDFLDDGRTLATVYRHNSTYRSYTWFSTRRYAEADFADLESLIACRDQFKIRLDFGDDFKFVVKPDIIYFPHQNKDYLVKSSAMLLPEKFVVDPRQYIASGRRLTANESYSLAYLNISSDDLVTIVHKQRFTADERLDAHARKGTLVREAEGRTLVTHVRCEHIILVPASRDGEPGRKETEP